MTTEEIPQELPARILLQIREGKNLNKLGDFTIRSYQERDGGDRIFHDVPDVDVVGGLSSALRDAIEKARKNREGDEDAPGLEEWLVKMRDWIFD